jgi:DNA modification methylase
MCEQGAAFVTISDARGPVDALAEAQDPSFALLEVLLAGDLDFHDQDSGYASHNFHSFPAKFPPQLPRRFIEGLSRPGEVVLDPMMGSGTTVLEAYLTGRQAVGLDIDPLALMLSRAKVTPIDVRVAAQMGTGICRQAEAALRERRDTLRGSLATRWDDESREFIDYWFMAETQLGLIALLAEIERVEDADLRAFYELAFSAIIITKSGGVSLALDLAHTRPHRAKVVLSEEGEVLLGAEQTNATRHARYHTKTLRSPIHEFERRVQQNLKGLPAADWGQMRLPLGDLAHPRVAQLPPLLAFGDAQAMPLQTESVDLIVTSPPYASNAIDYMRAHKFSLVWLGHSIGALTDKRREYIGGEAVSDAEFEQLPPGTRQTIAEIAGLDRKKGLVLRRYFSEMDRVLREMWRVLRPGKAAILIVGSSMMRGRDTETHTCLAEIGREIGFLTPAIGVRRLDRNRRMMPAGSTVDLDSQIQQRMHEEYAIGFWKPTD